MFSPKQPSSCQILVAINVIAKLSFSIEKPFYKAIKTALAQLKRQNFVEKLKTNITISTIPQRHEDLLEFLYNQINEVKFQVGLASTR